MLDNMTFAFCGELFGRFYANLQNKESKERKNPKTLARFVPLFVGMLIDILFIGGACLLALLIWFDVIALSAAILLGCIIAAGFDLGILAALLVVFLNASPKRTRPKKST